MSGRIVALLSDLWHYRGRGPAVRFDPEECNMNGNFKKHLALKVVLFCLPVLFIAGFFLLNAFNTADASALRPTTDAGSVLGSKDLDNKWLAVDALYKKGLPKSALEIVAKIYAEAKVQNLPGQLVKALIFKVRFTQEVEEESFIKIQTELNDELKGASFPVKPLLYSMLAELYWNYYRNNRYSFLSRSATSGDFKQEDIRTWDARRLVEAVQDFFEKSLLEPERSKKIDVDVMAEVLYKGRHSNTFRPTLYDFLAHRAIDFYMDQEAGLTKPHYQFSLNDDVYFSDTKAFGALRIETEEKLSFPFHAISYLQRLVNFHLGDKDPQALVDVELKRLDYVYRNVQLSNKDTLLESALRRLMSRYETSLVNGEIYYQLAMFYDRLGNQYNPLRSKDYKDYKIKAYELCREAISKYPGTIGAINCRYLMNQLEGKGLNLLLERIAAPNQPARALLEYRNLDRAWFRIVKTNHDEFQAKQRMRREDMLAFYTAQKSVADWQVVLPKDRDFQNHSCEIKLDGQPQGMYVLLTATGPDFNFKNNAVAYTFFNVSNIAYIERSLTNRSLGLFLLNRFSGLPLTGAQVQILYREYDRVGRRQVLVKGKILNADADGFLKITAKDVKKNYFQLEFIHGDDRLVPDSNFSIYSYEQEYHPRVQTYFFSDRSIYRPGQTVYFKGIMVSLDPQDDHKNKILPNQSSTVVLYDVNNKKTASLQLKTNEYGTFSGTFQLPTGVLNGNMRIADNYGALNFSMEEYKRPKFKTSFKPSEKSYRLNEKVTVKGQAEAYAGYKIANAQVAYRVERSVFYPCPWYYWRLYGDYATPQAAMEICNGITKTDGDGSFDVSFDALPDTAVAKDTRPAFMYTVHADVTDVNGETRSATHRVYVGYIALSLNCDLPDTINKDNKTVECTVNSTTLSGDFIPAAGTVTVHRLHPPDRVLRGRMWAQPDKSVLDESTFKKLFPNDPFADENDYYTWEKAQKTADFSFDTKRSKTLRFSDVGSWKPGKYIMELTAKDRYGSEVKTVNYFTLFSASGKDLPFKTTDWFSLLKGTVEPGGNAQLVIGTGYKNVRLIYQLEHNEKIISRQFITLSEGQVNVSIPISEEHRGGLGVNLIFLKNNRVYEHSLNITVPWSNKTLDVSFATFRNVLEPGSKEEWRLKLKGPDGEQVAAEMTAALYDASLDAFKAQVWNFNVFSSRNHVQSWNLDDYFQAARSALLGKLRESSSTVSKSYDRLNWFQFDWYGYNRSRLFKSRAYKMDGAPMPPAPQGARRAKVAEAAPTSRMVAPMEIPDMAGEANEMRDQNRGVGGVKKKNGGSGAADNDKQASQTEAPVMVRSNFNETAFFYPHLKTNEQGDIIIAFTIPEALTKWKMMGLAHTKDLKSGFVFNELTTRKDLMVVPNAPRFFREGDSLVFTTKITNLSDKTLDGTAFLSLLDAETMQPVDALFKKKDGGRSFTAQKGQSAKVSWQIQVPDNLQAVTYRITAKADKFSDGEENALPILKNRMLVTESLPLPVREKQTKSFKFKKLLDSAQSKTMRHHKLTLEFTSNPVWYAVQALPYLMEYPHECMEQVFSRYYANSLASYIVNADPKIKRVFDLWKNAPDGSANAGALMSNLEKNQDLKALMLEETPWVVNGQNESQRKRRIALLFDLNSMASQLDRALRKLKEEQLPSGAWSWFKGMEENRYITQHIVCGFAHLDRLKAVDVRDNTVIWNMMKEAVPFLDRKIAEDYQWLITHDADLTENHLSSVQVHYLYARSYFPDIQIHDEDRKAFDYYKGRVKKYWTKFRENKYLQGMMALVMKRYNDNETADDIARSIKEYALYSEEMGMYWKNSYGYYWNNSSIETHALLIEVFDEVLNDAASVAALKTWLLKQKQTQDWRTTKATVEAIYALLLKGDDWLKESNAPEITIGTENPVVIVPGKTGQGDEESQVEAGTGYFKTSWNAGEITPDMGTVTVLNNNNIAAWGALYWQYFENLDKITPAKTPLHLEKKLFLEKPSDTGPVLHPITPGTALNVGDRVKVRIELRVDRDMEYIHMKDMRAATMEPEQVLSGYRRQDGLGYYQTTRDASTNFFIGYLGKGTYVFEYPLRVTHEGDFSNGITSIQCMYAPEFTSHSEGVRVQVGGK